MRKRARKIRERKMRKRTTQRRKKKKRKRRTLILRLGLPQGLHSTQDPPGLEVPRTQASTGPTVPCPSSHPQDLRVKRREDGPLY